MKSKLYTTFCSMVLLLAAFSVNKAYSGGGTIYKPAEYRTYRVYDYSKSHDLDEYGRWRPKQTKSKITQNCELWQELTSTAIPLDDIYQAVYRYTSKEIERITNLIEQPAQDTLMQNRFVEWIVTHKDRKIAELLSIMKLCEEIRMEQNNPWYYPTDKDQVSVTLSDVARRAMAYNEYRLRDRYAIQAIRALFASSQYDRCINYWNEVQPLLPDGLIKQMIRPYIAGTYYRIGEIERATRLYAECGDIESLLFCAKKQGKPMNEIGLLELLCNCDPNSPQITEILQNRIRAIEDDLHSYKSKSWDEVMRLRDLARKVAQEGKASNRAMWYYTAAYLTDLDGDTQTASNLLSKAEAVQGNDYIKESIMVLRIYLNAKSSIYNAKYEEKLLRQLRWLDNKIKTNIDDRVRKATCEGFDIKYNRSYYYWNDMLRKIVFSVIAPRYIEQGNYTRAIQLANMADNNLLNIVNKQTAVFEVKNRWEEKCVSLSEYRKGTQWDNVLDYRNNLFALIDTVGVNHLIAYTERLQKPQTAFDRFINQRSYTDTDYFNEIIGTQCLREMRYADAIKYFGKVSAAFQYSLNTYKDGFMKWDPFSHGREKLPDNSDYKYNFAREMYSLEQSIKQTEDPNRKALLQIRYIIGLENSINRCWALTQYYKGDMSYWLDYVIDWTKRPAWKRAEARQKRLLSDAFDMITDREVAADAQWILSRHWIVMKEYSATRRADYLRRHCDLLRDYAER